MDDLEILNCNFTNNIGNYGALALHSPTIVDNCNLFNNIANEWGGAFFCRGKAKVNISNSRFYNNFADYGGAMYIRDGEVNLVNCQLYNNSAFHGGAIVNEAKLNINNTDFNNNNEGNELNNILSRDKNAVYKADEYSLNNLVTAKDINFQISDLQYENNSLNFNISISYFDKIPKDGNITINIGSGNDFTFDVVDGFANITLKDFKPGVYKVNLHYMFSGKDIKLTSFNLFVYKNNDEMLVSVKN